ncbi:GGDEF domain-containing protein [Pseudoalteromonas phenolica]|uniref:GGDEF domain-containing protein n=1 Tax=Pseudoalteromonas phenolica TaxID=161398 RepID=UPI00110A51FA|nr:GGDEF domain-containing protein [Pseudoalteromonas phenolica]TMO56739.1 GGDEF domain-containing protein [Pseudoalteromonas phenolica]
MQRERSFVNSSTSCFNRRHLKPFLNFIGLNPNTLIDLFSSNHHSSDFTQKRSMYIRKRLWVMCCFFAFSVPLFSIYDFYAFEYEQATSILICRLVLSASLFIMAYLIKKCCSSLLIKKLVALSFFLPSLFYLASMMTFDSLNEVPFIFSMLPYLVLAMVGLFPLTIRGSLILMAFIFFPFAIVQGLFYKGDVWSLFNSTWLFILFAGISLWLQIAQLTMLMHLYRESTVDPLTKLINRRVLLRSIEHLKSESIKFSVIMFDLDRFKRINDTFGHIAGDKVLKVAASVLSKSVRSTDIVSRYGGEEFLIILPHKSNAQALNLAHEIATRLRETPIAVSEAQSLCVTSSIGVTEYRSGETTENIFKRVDELLYDAKEQGRDRVISDAA